MTPRLPPELVESVISFVYINEKNTKMKDLKSCSLVARSWSRASQKYILRDITIPSFDSLSKWVSEIDLKTEIPSLVRKLTLRGNGNVTRWSSPVLLPKPDPHLAAFRNLECLTLQEFHLHSGIKHAKPILEWFTFFWGRLKSLYLESCLLSPNAFQSILHNFPHLDDLSINNECRVIINTEEDSSLKPPLRNTTNFRGELVTGAGTPQEFLSCLMEVPLRFHRLVCVFSKDGYHLVSACVDTLQILVLEVEENVDDVQFEPVSFPELHTLEFFIEEWQDVEPMIYHYFPLIQSAPKLSTIKVELNKETKDADCCFLRDSSGWNVVDHHLCRLAEGASGPVTLVLDTTSSLNLTQDVSEILDGSQFLPEFKKRGGLIRLR